MSAARSTCVRILACNCLLLLLHTVLALPLPKSEWQAAILTYEPEDSEIDEEATEALPDYYSKEGWNVHRNRRCSYNGYRAKYCPHEGAQPTPIPKPGGRCSSQLTLEFIEPTAGESCSDACKRLDAVSDTCPWRALTSGSSSVAMCLASASINGVQDSVFVAGMTPASSEADCQIASTDQGGGAFKLTRDTSPLRQQQCVCSTCQGEGCWDHFWLRNSKYVQRCPYKPPLHLAPSITTFFNYPGALAQQPHVEGLRGGNWCRFRSATRRQVGYVRDGMCHAGNGESSQAFDVFCPFMVSTCKGNCGAKGLVDRSTQQSCYCDYYCKLYDDCCGQDSSNDGDTCPDMAPSIDLALTKSCPLRTGLAAGQSACNTFRPAGCYCDQFCTAARDCCDDCTAECGPSTCPARREKDQPHNSTTLPRMRFLEKEVKLPRRAKPFFTITAQMLEREQACATAIEGQLPPPTTIEVLVVYVSAKINGTGGVINQTAISLLINELNATYARGGFSFKLAQNYTADFDTLVDAQPDFDTCVLSMPESGCKRCKAYKMARPELQNPKTLFVYGVAAAAVTPYEDGGFIAGVGTPPQWILPANPGPGDPRPDYRQCADGVYIVEPGYVRPPADYTIPPEFFPWGPAHEIGHWLGLSHTFAQSNVTQAQGCRLSAKYTSWVDLDNADSDAVRDTPPQTLAEDFGGPIFFDCSTLGPDMIMEPLQSCTSKVGFPQGDRYYANFANTMSYFYFECTAYGKTFTPGQWARARCVYDCYRDNQCFDGSFRW